MKYFIGLLPFIALLFIIGWLVVKIVFRVRQQKELEKKIAYINQEDKKNAE